MRPSTFEVDAGVTARHGWPDLQFSRRSRNHDKACRRRSAQDGVRRIRNLTQYWLDDKELRLSIYSEREAAQTYGSVELTILTKASDEGAYDGRYELAVYRQTADADKATASRLN